MEEINAKIKTVVNEIVPIYFDLHQTPELSGNEIRTAEKIGKELESYSFKVTYSVGGHGLVGILRNGKGKTLMIRTDMDALPVVEDTGLAYSSKVQVRNTENQITGVMHACGHDVHMSVALGTAKMMAELKSKWSGTLILIGQPSEETGKGSQAMLEDGLFTRFPLPDAVIGQHVHPKLPAGTVGWTEGFCFANVDTVEIEMFGRGGHGAMPHETIDPVVMASKLVLSLQTIVSREIAPTDPAVITVGSIHGGTKSNIIPDSVKLQCTVRSMSDQTRQTLLNSIQRMAQTVARGEGVKESNLPKISINTAYVPSVFNNPNLNRLLKNAFENILGPNRVLQLQPEMIGEDFSRLGRTEHRIPIVMFRLGTAAPEDYDLFMKGEKTLPGLHSKHFAPMAPLSIETGIKAMSFASIAFLK